MNSAESTVASGLEAVRDAFVANFHRGADRPWAPPSAEVKGWHKDGSFFRHFLDSRERGIGIVSATGEKLGDLKPRDLPSKKKIVPKSFKIDRDDNIYILDIFSERVLVLDPEGRYLRHLDFPEEYGFFTDLAVDAVGTILLLDGVDASVYRANRKAEGFSRLGESLKEFVNYPTSLATDDTGTLYVVDQFGSGLDLGQEPVEGQFGEANDLGTLVGSLVGGFEAVLEVGLAVG